MKKLTWIVFAAAIPAFAQQTFDFKTLDKMGANATESTNITLEGDTLRLATSFLGNQLDMLKNLTGVYVRSFEYAKSGQYRDEDLAPLRTYLKTLNWTKIIDVKESEETSEIFLQPLPDNKLGGLAIVSAEPKEVTVVFISGTMNINDVGKLGGNLGIPNITLDHRPKDADSNKKD
jgi:Domain of unknown function (DUF4252)